jgi:hypothetical protein
MASLASIFRAARTAGRLGARSASNVAAGGLFAPSSIELVGGSREDILGQVNFLARLGGSRSILSIQTPEDSARNPVSVEIPSDAQGANNPVLAGFASGLGGFGAGGPGAAAVFAGPGFFRAGGRADSVSPVKVAIAGAASASSSLPTPRGVSSQGGMRGRAVAGRAQGFGALGHCVGLKCAFPQLANQNVQGQLWNFGLPPACSSVNGCAAESAASNTGAVYDGNAGVQSLVAMGGDGGVLPEVDGTQIPNIYSPPAGDITAYQNTATQIQTGQLQCQAAEGTYTPIIQSSQIGMDQHNTHMGTTADQMQSLGCYTGTQSGGSCPYTNILTGNCVYGFWSWVADTVGAWFQIFTSDPTKKALCQSQAQHYQSEAQQYHNACMSSVAASYAVCQACGETNCSNDTSICNTPDPSGYSGWVGSDSGVSYYGPRH